MNEGEVYFTSDWHLGYEKSIKYRTQFSSVEEHDRALVKNYISIVDGCDTVYFLGDIINHPSKIDVIQNLPGIKILLLGNHDQLHVHDLLQAFNSIVGPISYGEFWLTHHPIHPQELHGRFNIHGHTHDQMVMRGVVEDERYINVCPDVNDYKPVSLTEIRKRVEEVTGWT